MSILRRGHCEFPAGRGDRIARRNRGWICWGLAALAASAVLVSSGRPAKAAEYTVKDLLGKYLSEDEANSSGLAAKYSDVDDAITRVEKGDLKGAREALEDARKAHKKLPPASLLLAQILIAANQGNVAVGELERCVKDNPGDPEAYLVLADNSFGAGRFTEADLLFQKADEIASKFEGGTAKRTKDCKIRAKAGLAAVAQHNEDWSAAKDYLTKWIELDSKSAAAHSRLGQVLFKADDSEDKVEGAKAAYPEFEAAFNDDQDKKTPLPAIAMGQMFEEAKMHSNAKKWYGRAIETLPTDKMDKLDQATAYLNVAHWAIDTNQAQDAFNDADTAHKLVAEAMKGTGSEDSDATARNIALDALYIKGVAARVLNDYDTAKDCLTRVQELAPTNFNARDQLAQLYGENAKKDIKKIGLQWAEINMQMSQAKNTPPMQSVEAVGTYAWILFNLDESKKAQDVMQQIEKATSLPPDCAYYQARLFEHQGQKDLAVKLLTDALKGGQFFVHRKAAEDMVASMGGGESSSKKPKKEESSGNASSGAPAAGGGTAPANNGTPPAAK